MTASIRPLRLPVESYVHCPRGGLVRVDRCDACDLMQGTLLGDRTEVLCAYPEPVPAVRHSHAIAVEPAAEVGIRDSAADSGSSLVFDCDWPDE